MNTFKLRLKLVTDFKLICNSYHRNNQPPGDCNHTDDRTDETYKTAVSMANRQFCLSGRLSSDNLQVCISIGNIYQLLRLKQLIINSIVYIYIYIYIYITAVVIIYFVHFSYINICKAHILLCLMVTKQMKHGN